MVVSEKIVQLVWEKGLCFGADSTIYRKDAAGAFIQRDQYGKEGSYGWTIDHIRPVSKGGNDSYVNLRPMQWENNRSKADDYPNYKAVIIADGNKNIRKEQDCTVDELIQAQLRIL